MTQDLEKYIKCMFEDDMPFIVLDEDVDTALDIIYWMNLTGIKIGDLSGDEDSSGDINYNILYRDYELDYFLRLREQSESKKKIITISMDIIEPDRFIGFDSDYKFYDKIGAGDIPLLVNLLDGIKCTRTYFIETDYVIIEEEARERFVSKRVRFISYDDDDNINYELTCLDIGYVYRYQNFWVSAVYSGGHPIIVSNEFSFISTDNSTDFVQSRMVLKEHIKHLRTMLIDWTLCSIH